MRTHCFVRFSATRANALESSLNVNPPPVTRPHGDKTAPQSYLGRVLLPNQGMGDGPGRDPSLSCQGTSPAFRGV